MKAGPTVVSASLEDYLEAIYHIVGARGAARAKDIAQAMDVKNASVTQALRSLAEKKLVNYAPYEVITLTTEGEIIARDVVNRHQTLERFLIDVLGLPDDEADEGACRLEHAINKPILERLLKFMEYFQTCPLRDIRWNDEAGFFCGGGADAAKRETCGRDICGHRDILGQKAMKLGEGE